MKKTNAIRLLEAHDIPYQLVEYQYDEEDLSVETIAAANELSLESIFKTLIAKGDKTGVIIAVVPGDKSLDFKSLAQATSNKKTTMVPVKDIRKLTGYVRGGCSPVGIKKDYPVVIDDSALTLDHIFVNAGTKGILIGVTPEALGKVTSARFAGISS